MQLQLPAEWSVRKKLPVFGPDCSSCSGSEYQEYFGRVFPDGVVVSVIVFPAGNNKLPELKGELQALKEKNPYAKPEILAGSVNQRNRSIEVTYTIKDKSRYCKMVRYVGRYRSLQLFYQGTDTENFRNQVENIQKSVQVDSCFLDRAKP